MYDYYLNNDHHDGFDPEAYERLMDLLEHTVSGRRRNFAIQFVIRFPDDLKVYKESQLVKKFFKTFIQNRNRQGLNCFYFWKRERSPDSLHGHYHVLLLMDGKFTQNLYGHMVYANKLWNSYFTEEDNEYCIGFNDQSPDLKRGLIYYNSQGYGNGIMLDRSSSIECYQKLTNLIQHLGYIVKNHTKNKFSKHGNTFGMTRGVPKRSR